MRLYVTARGRWSASQAEIKRLGKEDGGWSQVEVPAGKAGLLAFLNDHTVTLASKEPTAATRAAQPAPPACSGSRWRVYVKGIFACVVLADNDDAARDAAISQLEVRAA